MDRTTLAVERAEQALTSFQEVLKIREASEIERDAAIQRFGFTRTTVVLRWKFTDDCKGTVISCSGGYSG